jgi:hypothetical protein
LLEKLIAVLKYTSKIYSIVHGVPILIFSKKRQELMKDPKSVILKFLTKVLQSMSFLGTFILSMRALTCQFRHRKKLDILNVLTWCLFCSVGVLVEDAKRAEDYSIFTIPRVIEGLWDFLRYFGYVKDIKHSLKIIFAISMALLLVCKVHYNEEMPESYKNQLNFFFGKEENENKKEKITFAKN